MVRHFRSGVRTSVSLLCGALLVPALLVAPAQALISTPPVNYPIAATNCKTITFDQWINKGDTITVTFDAATYAGPAGSYCMTGANSPLDTAVVTAVFTDANGQTITPAIPANFTAWPDGTLVLTAVGGGSVSIGFADAFTGVNGAFRFDVRVPPATPATPTVTLSETTATISVSRTDSGPFSEPDEFVVTATPDGATCTISLGALQSSCDIAGLTRGTTYTFTATGTNSAGTSDPSAASAGVTPAVLATRPDPPTSLSATPGDGEASIVFQSGADGGSPVTNYEYSLNSGPWLALSPATVGSPVTVPGLLAGVVYSIRLRAVNGVGESDPSAAVSVRLPAVPVAPGIVSAVPGDRSALISVAAGSGGAAAQSFRVVADPGGRTCLVSGAAGGACTVSGLTNGQSYVFTAYAVNTDGDSEPSAPSAPVIPFSTAPEPVPVPVPVQLGEALLQVNGRLVDVTVSPTSTWSGLQIQGPGFSMNLDGLGQDGKPLGLTADGVLLLQEDRQVQTSGTGFRTSSEVDLFMDPPVAARSRAAQRSIYVGTVRTDAQGSFSGRVRLPDSLAAGQHTLQAVGLTRAGAPRSLSLGVLVTAASVKAPGGVSRLTATSSGLRTTVLTWSRPTNGAGARFAVRIRAAGGGVVARSATGALTQAVKGLVPGCTYIAEVTAVTAAGRGPGRSVSFVAGVAARAAIPMGDARCRPI